MTEQETQIERRFATLEQQVSTVAAKVDMLVVESQQQREDIRRAQEKHDADMKEMNQRFYAKFDAMDAKVDANFKEFAKQLHSNFVQTMIGVGAIMAAIGGLLIAALK